MRVHDDAARPAGSPPAGNPPAGNPPAGNPPAGNPPAGRCYYRAFVGGVTRHESLSQKETETRAREIYAAEGVICDIVEVDIQPPA